MAEDVIFKLEIEPDKQPELEAVARLLLAWVDTLETAAAVVDPEYRLRVELAGVEDGSDVFKAALKRLKDGADRYPDATRIAITLGSLIASNVLMIGMTVALTPDPRIPEDQMAVFHENNRLLAESVELQRKSAQLFEQAHEIPAIREIVVLDGVDRRTLFQVPRSEFAERSGLWSGNEEAAPEGSEVRFATWDVILLKPVASSKPRRWTFIKDGLPFSALMTDKRVLSAIHDRTFPLQIAEGVMMKLEIRYRERFDGAVWIPQSDTFKVIRVLSPALPPPLTEPDDLLSRAAGPPEEDQQPK